MNWIVASGLWVAATASALAFAAASALGSPPSRVLLVVVVMGTLAVYAADRWVDDGVDKPLRTRFLRRAGRLQLLGAFVAATVAGVAALQLREASLQWLAGVLALSALHHWLRRIPWLKPLYIATAWLVVVVVVPGIEAQRQAIAIARELAPIGLAIVANVLACDACDREAEARQLGVRRTWWIARAVAAVGVLVGCFVVDGRLVPIPLFVLASLIPLRATERYASIVLDGALLVGAVVSILWQGVAR